MPAPPQRLLSVSDTADRLDMTNDQVMTLFTHGHIRPVYPGSSRDTPPRVVESDLDRYIESLRHDPFNALPG